MVASKYAVIGGFAKTSNCLAGFKSGVGISGTMAHSFVCGFQGLESSRSEWGKSMKGKITVKTKAGDIDVSAKEFVEKVNSVRNFCESKSVFFSKNQPEPNQSELMSFISYSMTFPDNFLALVDTYDSVNSGVPNYLFVSAVLILLGFTPKGIRLDSGALKELSIEVRKQYRKFEDILGTLYTDLFSEERKKYGFTYSKKKKYIENNWIVASNDLNEDKLRKLFADDGTGSEKCEIDVFGIGTHLATCQAQPALGMVYKLTQISDRLCIKFSNEVGKQTYPGSKMAVRLYFGEFGQEIAVGDILLLPNEGKMEEASNVRKHSPLKEFILPAGEVYTRTSNVKVPQKFKVEKVEPGKCPKKYFVDEGDHFMLYYTKAIPLYHEVQFKKRSTKGEETDEDRIIQLKERVNGAKKAVDYLLDKVKANKEEDDLYPVLLSSKLVTTIDEIQTKQGYSKLKVVPGQS